MKKKYTVRLDPEAKQRFERFRKEDPEGIGMVVKAMALLANDPRPSGASPCGKDRYRIHVANYRLMYEVNDSQITVKVFHVGRTP